MNVCPTRTFCYFLCFSGMLFLVHLSCSKDVDTLRDTVLKKETVLVSEEDSTTTDSIGTNEDLTVIIEEDSTEIKQEQEEIVITKQLESRTTVFPVIHDAYLQNGKGYDLSIVRLQENLRTSYLMFDLGQIDSIRGKITSAHVEFVIDTDDGNGKIEVFKGRSNDWTERNLSGNSAPEIDTPLGYIEQEYRINTKTHIDLNAGELLPEVTTLIFGHTRGDDLAFASKENQRSTGGQLVVTYDAPVGAEAIVIDIPENNPEVIEEEVTTANEAEEVTEEMNEEANTDTSTEQEPVQEEDTNGELVEEEPTEEEEVIQDQASEQETQEEDVAEESNLEEEVVEEADAEEEISNEEVTQEEETTEGEDAGNNGNDEETTAEENVATQTQEEDTAQEESDTQQNNDEEADEETTQQQNGEEEAPTKIDQSNSAPVTIADATPLKGTVPHKVTFTAANSSDDKVITSYAWDFGDGKKASTESTVHTFTEAGSYQVILKTTDEEGLSSTDTIEIIVKAKNNEKPVAKASADEQSGTAPFQVDFSGSDSTDDDKVTQYFWDFKDGATSDKENSTHTFDSPGSYNVELSVKDKEGLTDKAILTITVNEPKNEAPKAVVSVNQVSGEAPLEVSFTGSNSSDDKAIVQYDWFIPGNPSSDANTTHIFNDAGTYDINFTVTDEEGLTDSTTLSIEVTPQIEDSSGRGQISCDEGGKRANETGRKIWCWNDIDIPEYFGREGIVFSNNELAIDSECYEKQVTKVGNLLKFSIDPVGPEVGDWCYYDYNRRAEIRTAPWNVRNPKGTEEWFGWSYTFSGNYKIDQANQWKFFQVHPGPKGAPQQISLEIIHGSQFKEHPAGEVYVVNRAHPTEGRSSDFSPTGIVPKAGQTLDIVVHVIWDRGSNGQLQVWINDQKVYDKNVSTILDGYPWGGNAKWGIYKWTWRDEEAVQKTLDQGIKTVETSMGSLRMITRKPGEPDYGRNSYSEVAPH